MEQTTKISINSLKIHPRNKEFFDDIEGDTYEQFKKSIQEDGVITPLIVAPDMTIVSGHQRYKACRDLGINLIPAIIREDLIDENIKLRQLIASNFGRLKNSPEKFRKAVAEYVELVGNKKGDNQHTQNLHKLNQDKIAKELGLSVRDLQVILSIEKNLIPELKQALDKGFITKIAALGICGKLGKSEQKELLSELTQLIGEKVESNTTKEKVSASNDEVKSLLSVIEQKNTENKKLAELNTQMMNKATQIEKLKKDLERKVDSNNNDYQRIHNELITRNQEVINLKDQIRSLKSVTEEEKYAKKLKDGAIYFCNRVNDFVREYGGLCWLSDHINELPDYERKSYIKAVEMMENWTFAIKANMKNYLGG
jgi:ParB-like chromosome segregation protein Spo0J